MRRSLSVLTALFVALALIPTVALADGHGECGDAYTPIYELQGNTDESPFHGDDVVTEGLVTVDLQLSSEHRGFFIQDLNGDGDAATSDGIFVNHQDTWSPSFDPSVGDIVRVAGTVDEQFGRTQIEWLSAGSICGHGNPAPLQLSTRQFNENPEQYEGMYIQYRGELYVSDTFNLHRFGEIWLGDDGVIETPTNQHLPSTDPTSALQTFAADNMTQVVMLEDGSRFSNPSPVPFLSGNGTLRIGDMTTNPTGAIYFDFGNYKMVNSTDPVFKPHNKRRAAPNVGGKLTVASFNVLNYWTTLGGRGASTGAQLAAQEAKLVSAIRGMNADIVALQEIENDHPADVPIMTLVAALNAAEGSDVWSRIEGFDQNIYPIVNEIIYRNDRVDPVGDAMTLVHSAFDDFRFGTPTPDNQLGRRPVAQAFEYQGEVFTVVNLHLKSKSCTGAQGTDLAQGDGQSCHNTRRVLQAQAVRDWIPHLQTESGDADVLVVGDLNAYNREDPIRLLESELSNLLRKYDKDPYSFNFLAFFAAPHIGRGTLDHALGTSSIAKQVTRVAIWHINADEPRFLDWFDPSRLGPGPYRSSDHDPVLIGLTLNGEPGNDKRQGQTTSPAQGTAKGKPF